MVNAAARPVAASLSEAARLPVAVLGGKAATLARLAAAGFPVPPGFVITSAAWAVSKTEIADVVRAMLTADDLRGADRYAVRSSAAAEDLPNASYAGQYETF